MTKYNNDTPEYQLAANIDGMREAIRAHQADADRSLRRVEETTKKLRLYEAALKKLDPNWTGDKA